VGIVNSKGSLRLDKKRFTYSKSAKNEGGKRGARGKGGKGQSQQKRKREKEEKTHLRANEELLAKLSAPIRRSGDLEQQREQRRGEKVPTSATVATLGSIRQKGEGRGETNTSQREVPAHLQYRSTLKDRHSK